MTNKTQSSRILVVDDEELNRDMLARRLRRRGFLVECADGAAQAEQRMQNETFDLVLLDIMMPEVDGFEYLERLRQRWQPAQLPVIMATAKTETDDVVRALEMGANDYVTKPLDFRIVLARVETQLRLKDMTEQLSRANELLEQDLERAARFQKSLLPQPNLSVGRCRFAWHYRPCDALAGDFLNVIPLDDDLIAFYVLDVSGHGTPAALMSAAIARSLSVGDDETTLVARKSRKGLMRGSRVEAVPPCEVLLRLNRQSEFDTGVGKYFTMAYFVIDVEAGEVQYALAGHPAQILVPLQGPCERLHSKGVPIGLIGDDELPEGGFQQAKASVNVGDRIYLFTDGLLEAANSEGEQFESARICEAMEATRSLPLDQSIERIIETITEFCEGQPFDDDLSIIGVEIQAHADTESGDDE